MSEVNPNISIIVPVYNVEKYLVRCLDSLFNQQFSGIFEVIAVEDGSTDNSLQALKSYQEREARLKVIEHGTNKKLSIARATGMKAATGDYIMHVDSDDWLLPHAFKNLYRKCVEADSDVVVFNHVKETNNGERTYVNSIKKGIITSDKLKVQRHFYGATWNKIVKRALTDNMISGEIGINMTEDLLYASEILLKARNICLLPEPYYVYFANTESLTWVIKPKQILENSIIVLQQIKVITVKYKATSKITNNILSYLEKYTYLDIAKIGFLVKSGKTQIIDLINAFRLFPEMTDKRLNKLSLSMSNKYYSLIQVFFRYGARPVFGIIIRSIKKLIINKNF